MHPDPEFRTGNRALMEALVEDVGFGMVFASTPDGPRVGHTPLIWTGDGALQFHFSRRNVLTPHLEGATLLVVVNGPDAYVSPRWYADAAEVPTWNYVCVELEGRVRRMDDDGLMGLLEALAAREEARVAGGEKWTMGKVPADRLAAMSKGIVGFEMETQVWRPTFKLSQNKSADDRERVALGLEAQGSQAIARLMREVAG